MIVEPNVSFQIGSRPSSHPPGLMGTACEPWLNREAIRALDAEAGAPHALQAPDPLLAHLAERPRIHRAPPPDRNAERVCRPKEPACAYAPGPGLCCESASAPAVL